MKKGFLDISFSWIFAILIGGIILFAAIYGVGKVSRTQETKVSAETATDIGGLLSSLETSIESAKSIYLKLPVESRIRNKCDSYEGFGRVGISIDEYIKNQWASSGINVYFENKYLFSSDYEEGRGFYAFTKPFEFPFKVANLIYLTSEDKEYCFVGTPLKMQKEIDELNQPNLFTENCEKNTSMIQVCFTKTNCDIVVGLTGKYVRKGTEQVYFDGDALMYAAIFSDKDIYECEVLRLMQRTKELTKIYEDKALRVKEVGCNSDVLTDLNLFESEISLLNSSKDLAQLKLTSDTLKNGNDHAKCKLW